MKGGNYGEKNDIFDTDLEAEANINEEGNEDYQDRFPGDIPWM